MKRLDVYGRVFLVGEYNMLRLYCHKLYFNILWGIAEIFVPSARPRGFKTISL